MENKNNTPVSEENLENVTGGSDDGMAILKCFFTPTGFEKYTEQYQINGMYAQCASDCVGLIPCRCFGKNHCVDKWHLIDDGTRALLPADFSNHNSKKPSNGYNT